jgi:hypothetical protein
MFDSKKIVYEAKQTLLTVRRPVRSLRPIIGHLAAESFAQIGVVGKL